MSAQHCHQSRCFLEERGTWSVPWSGGVFSTTPELCPTLDPLAVDLFIGIGPLPMNGSLSSASVPTLSVPHVLPACTLSPLSPPSPEVAAMQCLPQENWVRAMATTLPSACPGRRETMERAGREGDTEPGNSGLVCCQCAKSCFTNSHPYMDVFSFFF